MVKNNTTIKELKHMLDRYGLFMLIFPMEQGLEVVIADDTSDSIPTKNYNLNIGEDFEIRFKELIKEYKVEEN